MTRTHWRRTGAAATAAVAVTCALAAAGAAARAGAPAGSLVRGFGAHGLAALGSGTQLNAVAVQRNGETIVAGQSGGTHGARVLVARLTASGRLDRHFGHGGIALGPIVRVGHDTGSLARAVALEPDGKIVIVGKATDARSVARDGLLVERFNANGSLDRRFGSHGVVRLLGGTSYGDGYAVAIERGGEILAAGSADRYGAGNGSYPRAAVVRLTASGRPDRHFATGGIAVLDLGPYSAVHALALSFGGRILIAGSVSPKLQAVEGLVGRLTSSGRLDRGFAGDGYYVRQFAPGGASSSFDALTTAPGGGAFAGGSTVGGTGAPYGLLVRFGRGGSPDGGFGHGGAATVSSGVNYIGGQSLPGITGLVYDRGHVLASGEYVNGVTSQLAVWGFGGGGGLLSGFGSHGSSLLRLASPSYSAGQAIALAPAGTVVVAGQRFVVGGAFRGLVARFGA